MFRFILSILIEADLLLQMEEFLYAHLLYSKQFSHYLSVCLSHRTALEKLHSVDDAFRRQLESIQAAHQAELLRTANETQKRIDQANRKVDCRHRNVQFSFMFQC